MIHDALFGEERLVQFLQNLGSRAQLPLRVALWNGGSVALGPAPRVTIRVPRREAARYLLPPSLDNLAEGYIRGELDVDGPIETVIEAAYGLARNSVQPVGRFGRVMQALTHTRRRDAQAIAHHYDVSNDFYQLWLGPQMVYSCAYFASGAETLEQAQTAKLDHILTKIMLQPNERLLDIGCGWGGLALRAASHFGARVTGVTLSQNQCDLARERVRAAGLAGRIEIRMQDYRDVDGQFDKITSVGMFEHVGLKHLPAYFGRINALLADGGLALNHGITSTDAHSGASPYGAGSFIGKYVFPQGELPHISLALQAMQEGGLEPLDVESLRRHYARTLSHWAANYETHSAAIRHLVNETTYRIWRIYLAGCARAFSQDWVSIYQVLACKAGADARLNPTPWSRAYMYQ